MKFRNKKQQRKVKVLPGLLKGTAANVPYRLEERIIEGKWMLIKVYPPGILALTPEAMDVKLDQQRLSKFWHAYKKGERDVT